MANVDAPDPNHKDTQGRKEQRDLAAARADDAVVVRRALNHLESLCATAEAHESFTAWRLLHARKEKNSALLPKGVGMDDEVVFEEKEQGEWQGCRVVVQVRKREQQPERGKGGRDGAGGGGVGGGRRTVLIKRFTRSLMPAGKA